MKVRLFRELAYGKKQLSLFVLCLILSLLSIVAIGGFSESAALRIQQDAKALIGGDIIVSANKPFSDEITQTIAQLENQNQIQTARLSEFTSIAYSQEQDTSLFMWIRAIDPAYPFYGQFTLQSQDALANTLKPGTILVDHSVLERLNVQVGDSIRVGETFLTIRDVITSEPGLDINLFATSRAIMLQEDLDKTGLVDDRSRVFYNLVLKLNSLEQLDTIEEQLKESAQEREDVDTALSAQSGLQRFIQNTLSFLNIIALFTMILSGIGMTATLIAYFRKERQTIAAMKTLGMKQRQVILYYATIVGVLALAGIIVGIGCGLLLQFYLPTLFSELLPAFDQVISLKIIAQGALIGISITLAFVLAPLRSLIHIKPVEIIRLESTRSRKPWITWISIFILLCVVVTFQMGIKKTSLYFIGGFSVLFLAILAVTALALFTLKKTPFGPLVTRQAKRSLLRPGNASLIIITSLTLSLSLIFTIVLIQGNLQNQFFTSFPEDSPNVFFIDIQKNQLEDFQALFEQPLTYFPVIRGNLLKINGEQIDYEADEERGGDAVSREFSLTYGDQLLADETIIKGDSLYTQSTQPEVSVLDDITNRLDLDTGDTLTFLIQGVEVDSVISSIRTREENDINPYFYFMFEEETLEKAPQTFFAALNIPKEDIPATQTRIARQFPSITTLDVSDFLEKGGEIITKLSSLVQFFSIISIIAGILILVSSIFATSIERTRDAVYYKVLGAKKRFVRAIFLVEYMLLALLSCLLAFTIAQVATWAVFKWIFDFSFTFLVVPVAPYIIGTLLLFPAIGMIASYDVLRKKPIEYLRQSSE